MNALDYAIEEYAEQHSSPMDETLLSLYRETYLHEMNPRMMSGPIQGRLLQFLCQMLRPARVLEIGTYTGFASVCIARGLPDGGRLVTIEANEEYEDVIRRHLEETGMTDRVELIIGDAKTVLETLKDGFDMAFIDADKLSYPYYYEKVVELVRPGGFILADNVLWDGKVLNPQAKGHDTQALRTFNDMVTADPRVENVLLPLRDGLMVIRKHL